MFKRITALVLCLCILLTLLVGGVYANDTADHGANVGKYAQLNPYYAGGDLPVHDGSRDFAMTEAMYFGYDEFEEGLIFRITDYYLDSVNAALWYQVEAYQGQLPADMPAGSWILQNYTDEEYADEDTLLFVEVEPEEGQTDVTLNGEPVSAVAMPKYDKPVLSATTNQSGDVSYRWQILADADLWVDIYGQTAQNLTLSYGKVASVLDENDQTQVRCVTTTGDSEQISQPVTVTLMPHQEEEATVFAGEPALRSAPMTRDANGEGGSTKTYQVTVNYMFKDGVTPAAEKQTITIPASGAMENDIVYPAVTGYLPYVKDELGNFVYQERFEATTITEDMELTVYYLPTQVKYRVEVYLQNINDDGYTKQDTVIERFAETGSLVPDFTQEQDDDIKLEYEGFYPLLHEMPEVAADGSTVVEVYFDRYYYLMTFNLDGGYGVDPIYARLGTKIELDEPTKPGNTFIGWDKLNSEGVGDGNKDDAPNEMPIGGASYKAIWDPDDTAKVTFVFWGENADDEEYSYITSKTAELEPGTNATYTENGALICDHHIHGPACGYDCGIEEHDHRDSCYDTKNPICGKTEHVVHTDVCYNCGLTEHTHSQENGCQLNCSHTHTAACYGGGTTININNNYLNAVEDISNADPVSGYVYHISYRNWNNTANEYYLYYNGLWYQVSADDITGNSLGNGTYTTTGGWYSTTYTANKYVAKSVCTHTSHDASCYECEKTPHTHSAGCGIKDELHTHSIAAGCYNLTCTKTVHNHEESDCAYDCGMQEGTHNSTCYDSLHTMTASEYYFVKSDTVEVKIDGTTVVNVYYDRTTFTLTFRANSSTVATITEKWGARIFDEFQKAPFNTTYNGRAWECTDEDKYSDALQTLDIMPKFDATFNLYNKSSETLKTIYYYIQIPGTTVSENTWPTSTANFTLLKEVDTYFNYATYNEEYHEMQGFKRYGASVAGFSSNRKDFSNNSLYLYYLRENYNLEFNNGKEVVKTEWPQYGQDLGSYAFTPTAPDLYEPGSVEFAGWYLNPECTGAEFKLDEHTMPAENVILYAKWEPKIHQVKVYMTVGATTTLHEYTIPHGELVAEKDRPPTPSNGELEFIGWFYKDANGKEHAFDFANMPVTDSMNLYAKWSSNVLKTYTIRYMLQGSETPVAAPISGSALAGTTKTFEAKGGDQLYADYREGYFPLVQSHSITMDIDHEGDLVYTFWYTWKEAVNYTVHYYEKDLNGDPVYVTDGAGNQVNKTVAPSVTRTTKQSAVVENYVRVQNYKPDEVQKKLVLSGDVDADNTIIFWYTPNTTHGFVIYSHYLEDIPTAGSAPTWTAGLSYMNEHLIVGNEAQAFTIDPETFEGFTYDPTAPGTVTSGTLDHVGQELELQLYYRRNQYPYQIQYLEYGTNKVLKEPAIFNGEDNAYFGDSITTNEIPDLLSQGYTHHSTVGCTIRVEENETNPAKNTITVYYVPINGNLQISKTVYNQSMVELDPNIEFEFVVSVPAGVTGTYSATIGGNTKTVSVEEGAIKVSIKNGESATIFGLPVGHPTKYTYQVGETPIPGFQANFEPSNEATLSNGVTSSIVCTNVYPVCDLVLIKTVAKEYDPDIWNRVDDEFQFVITSPSLINGRSYTVKSGSVESQYTVADHTITLEPITVGALGEIVSLTLKDIPIGDYTVTETMDDATKALYATTANGVEGDTANITLSTDNLSDQVDFVNVFKRTKGNLYLEKTLVAATGFNPSELPEGTKFSFTITLTNDPPVSMPVQVSYNDGAAVTENLNNGTLTVILEKDQHVMITGLPVGNYHITEATIPSYANTFYLKVDGEWVKQTPVSTALGALYVATEVKTDETTQVRCENTYPVDRAELVLQKLVTKEYAADTVPSDSFLFTVQLKEEDRDSYNYVIYNQDGSVHSSNNTATVTDKTFTVTLKAGQYAVLPDMPVCGYTITEGENTDYTTEWKVYQSEIGKTASTTVNTSGTASASGDTASMTRTFAAGKTDTVVFTNQYKRHLVDLTIVKTNAADNTQVFVYEVVKSTGESMTVTVTGNDSVTIHDVPVGEYTVTQKNEWSWRYDDGSQTVTIAAGDKDQTVTFDGGVTNHSWLDGNSDLVVNSPVPVKKKKEGD